MLGPLHSTGCRKCSRCGFVKPLEDFYRSRDKSLGREYHCRECDSAKRKRRYETPPTNTLTHRQCYRCKETKPLEEFSRRKEKPLGRSYLCSVCNRIVAHKWRTDNLERARTRDRKRIFTPEQREAQRKYSREWMREHRKNHFSGNANLWQNHGITQAQYDAMHVAQNGRCAICQTDKPTGRGKKLHVDHCHRTKKIRRLLCQRCNSAIGFLEYLQHNHLLEAAISYLNRTWC